MGVALDRFGNPIDPEVGYARGIILRSSEDEALRRRRAMDLIRARYEQLGREGLFDLTGLSGGFLVEARHLDALETYVGHALFYPELKVLAREHLGTGEVLAFNRTTAGILATCLALLREGDRVVHYVPKRPAHPSFPRSVKLAGGEYVEVEDPREIARYDDGRTRLVAITGATMDHVVPPLEALKEAIELGHRLGAVVLVDDASGARIRTAIHGQPRARDLGADLVITSTDKLMPGPRAGLMVGEPELVHKIRAKAYELGLEAQPPVVAAIVGALRAYRPEKLKRAYETAEELYSLARREFGPEFVTRAPTGIVMSAEDVLALLMKLSGEERPRIVPVEASSALAMLLIERHGIITIPAVGAPGASPSIRIDASSPDMERTTPEHVVEALGDCARELARHIGDIRTVARIILGGDMP